MMREARLAGIVPAARSCLHRRAARLLQEAGADESKIAAQLLAAEPGSDERAAAVLDRTGQAALASGDPDVAVHHLRRALAENVSAPPELLLALALAEARAGDPAAREHLEAAAAAEDPVTAARAAQALARVLIMRGRADQAAGGSTAASSASATSTRRSPRSSKTTSSTRSTTTPTSPPSAAAGSPPPPTGPPCSPTARSTSPPRRAGGRGARRWRRGPSRTARSCSAREQPAVLYAIEALMAVEAADEARAAIERVRRRRAPRRLARRRRRRRDHPRTLGARVRPARGGAGVAARARGRDPDRALRPDAVRAASQAHLEASAGALAAALLDAGELDEAEQLIADLEPGDTGLPICGYHALRGRIRLARGRAPQALADLEHQLALEAAHGWVAYVPRARRARRWSPRWPTSGASTRRASWRQPELTRARERGLHGHEARLLLASARLALAREQEIELLEAAVAAARRSPSRLIQAEALVRARRRAAPRRPPRRRARSAARGARAGAAGGREGPREARARGARDRGRAAAARRAGRRRKGSRRPSAAWPSWPPPGRRNREIAEELFVTLKTVEVHLGRAYAKLGISSRSQLACF